MSRRSAVTAKTGIVSSSHELASFWGATMMLRGGNVIDAAITTSAVLTVVQNNACGLGGDLFALIKIGGKVLELNGSGRAAKAATIDFYKENGYDKIPSRGPLAALTVPGIVHAWGELIKYASMELKELLAPAISYAENGVPLNAKYVESIRDSESLLGSFEGWRKLFTPDGKIPKPGFLLKQGELSDSLKTISENGTETFYKGALADRIVKGIKEQGGLIDSEDLSRHESTWKDPIFTDYHGTKIYETSPNSQAATVLLWLNMLESYGIEKYSNDRDKHQEILIRSYLYANQERSKRIADPVFLPLPPEFTSKEYARSVLSSEHETGKPQVTASSEGDDTTYFAVADKDGNGASIIQSNFNGFGSGLVPRGTGIVLHNRGSYFSLDQNHHNALAPGKRTFHTLCASLGELEGKTLFALGSMGGDIQPQVHVQLMTKILDLGWDLQNAIDAPRWAIPSSIYEQPSKIYYEEGIEPSRNTPSYLKTERLQGVSSLTGHANAIMFVNGSLFGAADPRCDGASIGF